MSNQKLSKVFLVLCDIFFINLSFILSLVFRFIFDIPVSLLKNYILLVIPIALIYIISFKLLNLYDSLWSYASVDELLSIIIANVLCNSMVVAISLISPIRLPYSVIIFAGILITMFTTSLRLAFRLYSRVSILKNKVDKGGFKRVLIVGAGYAGISLLKDINITPKYCYLPVGFIDDNPYKKNKVISGV